MRPLYSNSGLRSSDRGLDIAALTEGLERLGLLPLRTHACNQLTVGPRGENQLRNRPHEAVQPANILRDADQIANRPRDVDQITNRPSKVDQLTNRPRDVDQMANRTPDVGQIANKTREVDQLAKRLQDVGQLANRTCDSDQMANRTCDVDQMANRPHDAKQMANWPRDMEQMAYRLSDMDNTANTPCEGKSQITNSNRPRDKSQPALRPRGDNLMSFDIYGDNQLSISGPLDPDQLTLRSREDENHHLSDLLPLPPPPLQLRHFSLPTQLMHMGYHHITEHPDRQQSEEKAEQWQRTGGTELDGYYDYLRTRADRTETTYSWAAPAASCGSTNAGNGDVRQRAAGRERTGDQYDEKGARGPVIARRPKIGRPKDVEAFLHDREAQPRRLQGTEEVERSARKDSNLLLYEMRKCKQFCSVFCCLRNF